MEPRVSHVALLVEDDPAWAKILGALLLALGHTFLHVTSLAEARAAIEEGGFCYVLLDMAADVACGETVLELLRRKYPHRNRDGRHRLQILVVTGFSNDGEFSSRLHQMDADMFVSKASLSRPGYLPDQIRKALAKAERADHAVCAELAPERASAIAAAPAEAAPVEPPQPVGPICVRFRFDGRRSRRRVGLLVNGVRLRLRDQLFLFVLRLVLEHLRSPQAWHTMADLGFPNNVVLTSRLRGAFRSIVPEGFVVLEKMGTQSYRLNPEILVEHMDWRALQEDEDPTIARVAREGARLGQA
jgi:CheY-like chemotaxis protein